MNNYLDRFNLSPSEKRLVVGVGVVFFFILNFWFVFPHFSDWSEMQFRMAKARQTLQVFQEEIAHRATYEARVHAIEKEGYSVPAEDQALHFASTVQSQAARAGIVPTSTGRPSTTTNQFFLEQSQQIAFQSKEPQIVKFLVNLSSGGSLIRVRDLTLRPDPPRYQLTATLKLVASYQKKGGSRAAASRRRLAVRSP